eukprot:2347761-Pleurochrysis_carterae.AAC.2
MDAKRQSPRRMHACCALFTMRAIPHSSVTQEACSATYRQNDRRAHRAKHARNRKRVARRSGARARTSMMGLTPEAAISHCGFFNNEFFKKWKKQQSHSESRETNLPHNPLGHEMTSSPYRRPAPPFESERPPYDCGKAADERVSANPAQGRTSTQAITWKRG